MWKLRKERIDEGEEGRKDEGIKKIVGMKSKR